MRLSNKFGWLLVALVALALGYSCVDSQASSVRLRWTSPGDDVVLDSSGQQVGATGTPARVIAYFALQPFDSTSLALADTVTICPGSELPGGQVQTCDLVGLRPGADYWIMLRGLDEAGNIGGFGNVIRVTAPDDVRPAAIVDLSWLP